VVTGVSGIAQAEAVIGVADFAYAAINLRLREGNGLSFVQGLRQRCPKMRIVVVTDADSFDSVIRTLGAGADDYKPQPVGEDELVDALLDRATTLPPIPETPLGLSRTCWEHIMRIYEQCDRNVSRTAQRLGMHRRSLQRVLSKRAPLPRVRQSCQEARRDRPW
jgi:two-component system response regulator RegA